MTNHYKNVAKANPIIIQMWERLSSATDMNKEERLIQITQVVKNQFGFSMSFVKKTLREAGYECD